MLLIFPPVAKPSEPPAGVALLSSALKENGIECQIHDANIHGLLHLIRSDMTPEDSWSERALKNRDQIIKDLKTRRLYDNMDRYHQRVYDLNRLLALAVDTSRFRVTLSDYSDSRLSSVNSRHLLQSAEHFIENPFYDYFETALYDVVQKEPSEYVGISMCYLNQALTSFALAGWIKARFKGKKIVMGGGLLSSWMSRPGYHNPFSGLVDTAIRGEGELPLLDLLGVDGKGKKHYVPDYDFVADDLYLSPGKVLPFRASIGCYWSKCRFCPEKAETRPYSSQRASHILQDLRIVEKKYTPDLVHLIDNSVTPSLLRMMASRRFGFKWYGFVRFEKDFTDLDFCRNLKKSGCEMLKLGLESGDQDVLDQMNKGTQLAMVSDILKNLDDAAILSFVYLLFGTGFENEAAAFKTMEFIVQHKKLIDYLNLAVFNLPKFSDDAKDLETSEFYHGDLSLYLNFKNPFGWNRRKVKHFLDKTFKKSVFQGGSIRRNPAFFSSNHAVFFPKHKGEGS